MWVWVWAWVTRFSAETISRSRLKGSGWNCWRLASRPPRRPARRPRWHAAQYRLVGVVAWYDVCRGISMGESSHKRYRLWHHSFLTVCTFHVLPLAHQVITCVEPWALCLGFRDDFSCRKGIWCLDWCIWSLDWWLMGVRLFVASSICAIRVSRYSILSSRILTSACSGLTWLSRDEKYMYNTSDRHPTNRIVVSTTRSTASTASSHRLLPTL